MSDRAKHIDMSKTARPTRPPSPEDKSQVEEQGSDEPMTDAQADLLKRLCEEANEPQAFDGELTKAQARDLIKEMRRRASLPH